jgi:serine/threonine-protein kinase
VNLLRRATTWFGRGRRPPRRGLSAGDNLGDYRLTRILGQGGMGSVWAAEHRLLGRPAAVKLIQPVPGQDMELQRQRFTREARTTAALSSPHTVTLYDFGSTPDGAFYYAMEALDGLDLEEVVVRHGPLPAGRVLHLLHQACDSLAEAHAIGLVHRDIKPANIFTCRLGARHDVVKILDFGLVIQRHSHRVADDPEGRLTRAGYINGTPGFMAPEQIRDESDIDGRADLYALGCVAWWLLTGSVLFDHDETRNLLLAHCHNDLPPLPERCPFAVPGEVVALVHRLLAKNREARPVSALALASELEELCRYLPWRQEDAATWWQRHGPKPLARLATAPSP